MAAATEAGAGARSCSDDVCERALPPFADNPGLDEDCGDRVFLATRYTRREVEVTEERPFLEKGARAAFPDGVRQRSTMLSSPGDDIPGVRIDGQCVDAQMFLQQLELPEQVEPGC
jgi:hypothetical protein